MSVFGLQKDHTQQHLECEHFLLNNHILEMLASSDYFVLITGE